MFRKLAIIAAIACLVFIAYATLSKQIARPTFAGHGESYPMVVIERLCAYGLLGTLLALAMPNRILFPITIVMAMSLILEGLQFLQPGRDPSFSDALQKLVGGIVGFITARWIERVTRNWQLRRG